MSKFITTLATVGVTLVLAACASKGEPKRTVLPLDHGPRAQTTPWENQQRRLHAQQQEKAGTEKSSEDLNK